VRDVLRGGSLQFGSSLFICRDGEEGEIEKGRGGSMMIY